MSTTKKVIFLGSKPIGYDCFAHLLSVQQQLNITIAGLITQVRREFGGDHDLAALATAHNIPVLNGLEEVAECDIMYSVQFHQIIKKADIAKARQAVVNLHMAPLPEYRGSNQFTMAILDKKEEFGTTIHMVDERIDHGDILFQKRFPIPEGCWVSDLYELTHKASVNLFAQTLPHVINGLYSSVAQRLLEPKYGTSLHFRKEINSLKVIDVGWEREKIERYVRATSMPGFEPPYCVIDGKKIALVLQK